MKTTSKEKSTMTGSTQWTRAHLLAPPAAVLALLIAGCSASPSPRVASLGPTTATTTAAAPGGASPGAPVASLDKYAGCMRAHGVANFPDPIVQQSAGGDQVKVVVTPAAGPGQSPAYNAAANACKNLAPPRPTPPAITPQDQQDYLNAARCMRSHGINGFPDPAFSGGGVKFPIPTGMNTDSPQFLQARQTCEKLIPTGLPYSN